MSMHMPTTTSLHGTEMEGSWEIQVAQEILFPAENRGRWGGMTAIYNIFVWLLHSVSVYWGIGVITGKP